MNTNKLKIEIENLISQANQRVKEIQRSIDLLSSEANTVLQHRDKLERLMNIVTSEENPSDEGSSYVSDSSES